MIDLIIRDERATESKPIPTKIREYSNLSEALYHAIVGEVIWITDPKTGRKERVERTESGWLYEILN